VPDAALAGVAADVRTQRGVASAVAARVVPVDPAQVGTTNLSTNVLLVDPAEFAALLAATPLADAPASWSVPGDRPRALVTGDLIGRGPLSLTWDHAPVAVDVVGVGPSIGTNGLPTVVVDAAAFGAAAGTRVDPDVLLVVGPGAEAAVRGADVDGEVVQRTGWLAEQRATPTTRAVTQLARACVLLLLALGAAAALMLASTGAGERAASLARMRTLGLDGRGARRVSAGELVPYALGATSVGVLVGWLVLTLTGQSLGLFAIGGAGFGHGVVVPWFAVAAPLLAVACMVVVVGVESGARRRERLGQVLRVGAA
jgi:putative ABC transport system permease protein